MYCTNCGTQSYDEARSCADCGKPISESTLRATRIAPASADRRMTLGY